MNETILIVDDSLTVRMDLADTFEAEGFHPLLCATLAEARKALAAESIGLAILDVVLPDGSGVDLLEEIRRDPQRGDLPILMLSSESDVHDRIRGLKTGANDYVGKPYNSNYVVARARELLRLNVADPAAPARGSILIIDDSLTFREALGEALRREGHDVLMATSGETGLRLAAAHRPAALIVDGVMPGMDGATVLRKIRLDAALRATPCLLLTASQDQGAELRALDAGADAFALKEADLSVIMARFLAMLRNSIEQRETVSSLGSPKRILAVDHSPDHLSGLASALRDNGYDVVPARSGEEAIEMLTVQNVDCILLDLDMPGLGGPETCRCIKASPTLRNTPLIMLTATEDGTCLVDALQLGADDCIARASHIDVLRARIQAQLRRKQFEDERRHVREHYLRAEIQETEARAARLVAETRAVMVDELRRKNEELESFSYSVSHDLKAPLRAIDGFSQALVEDCAAQLDADGLRYLDRIRSSATRMATLIDDMLQLSKVGRAPIAKRQVDLSAIARQVSDELKRTQSDARVTVEIAPGLHANIDAALMRIVLDNLIGNAWKFSAAKADAMIEFGVETTGADAAFFVRDNGAGFDMKHAGNLFQPFKRLHPDSEFDGTGIGLATVRRIIERHGGRVWAEGSVGSGATVRFIIPGGVARQEQASIAKVR